MKSRFKILMFVFLMAIGCEDNNLPTCIMGTIVGYEGCGDAVLVQVDNKFKIGKTLTYYDKSTYDNVVRAPGQYGFDTIYFRYRPYNKTKDKDLFYNASTRPCLAIYGPFDVPTIVITDYSTKNCNELK